MLMIKDKNKRYNDPGSTLDDLQRNGLQRYEIEDFVKFIRGLKCECMLPNQPHTRRVYKMNGCKKPCSEHRLAATSFFLYPVSQPPVTVGKSQGFLLLWVSYLRKQIQNSLTKPSYVPKPQN